MSIERNDEHAMDTTSRFAAALKRLRLAKRWKQGELAEALHVTLRAVVSWETGERIPSPGMVIVLCMLLTDDQGTAVDLLSHELLIAYLLDDMQRQTKVHSAEAFRALVHQVIGELSRLSEEHHQPEQAHEVIPFSLEQAMNGGRRVAEPNQSYSWQSGELRQKVPTDTLQQLFALFDQLRQHPELIAVVYDFLREVTPS